MTELVRKQLLFSRLFGQLIARIYTSGFAFQMGEGWRTDAQAVIHALGLSGRLALATYLDQDTRYIGLASALRRAGPGTGIALSLHRERLAVDIILREPVKDDAGAVIDWAIATSDKYEPFGVFWEGLDPLARWGGRWSDYGHFSLEHGGRK